MKYKAILQMNNTKLNSSILLNNFTDIEDEYEIETDQDWFRSILTELEKEIQAEPMPQHKGDLYAHLRIKRLKNTAFKDHLAIRGRISSAYTASCIRCLTNVDQEFEIDFNAVYIHEYFENSDDYKETTHIFCDGEEMELYFLNKGNIDLKELLYDQAFIGLDHLPLHHEDCKGLCQHCGIDLNHESCSCKKV